jgi:hypothetical protein
MTPLEIIRRAQAGTLIDKDGNVVTLELFPGLSNTELQDFANRVPGRIPPEIAELLDACSGFYGTVEQVDFSGRDLMFDFDAAFPYGLPIAADGYGNFWVVDLLPATIKWGPIYFACHDAPVILYQADSLEQFLRELFRMFEPPHQSLIDDVHEDRLAHVWQTNPGVLSQEQCLRSEDTILSAFARELDETFHIMTCAWRNRETASPGAATGPRRRSNASARMPCSPIRSPRVSSPGSSDVRVDKTSGPSHARGP